MHPTDVCIAGAGIIGLSLALELEHHGASVTVLERDTPLLHASQAAAGMLAAHDPDNPPALLTIAELSLSLYPTFLTRIEHLSGQKVLFQTTQTYQSVGAQPSAPVILPPEITPGPHTFALLNEYSLDPRQLAPALLAAVRATSIRILDRTTLRSAYSSRHGVDLETSSGHLPVGRLVHTLGPWSLPNTITPISPRKGQMLSVRIPPSLALDYVVRTPEIYIVPRTQGIRAGQAILGATIEDAGFDTRTDSPSLAHLRALAARLLPALADESAAPSIDHWAGLRPNTPDHLPLLGPTEMPNQFLATGHYRNGILLAPATAHVLAQLLADETPSVDLTPFSPARYRPPQQHSSSQPIFAHST